MGEKALRALMEIPAGDLSDEQLTEVCAAMFEAEPVPPCRVCGKKLEPAAMDAGKTVWACSGYEDTPDDTLVRTEGRSVADKHYTQSLFTQFRRGNMWGEELLRRFARLQDNPDGEDNASD